MSIAKQVNHTGSVHTTESFSSTIRNDVLTDATKWRSHKNMMLRARIQTRAATPGFHSYSTSKTGTNKEIESRRVVARIGEKGQSGGLSSGYGVSVGDDEKVLELVATSASL